MNTDIVDSKSFEYIGRVGAANALGDLQKAKKDTTTVLGLCRLNSRLASQSLAEKAAAARALHRSIKKAETAGIAFPFGRKRLTELKGECEAAEEKLAHVGELISLVLDIWQDAGATLEDLCNLCNRDSAQVRGKVDSAVERFSEMVYIYNLDYKDPRNTGWIEDEVDAPLTHAVKAYWLDIMLHTEKGQKATREAMNAVFPEIFENALTVVTDADGNRRLIDKDGVDVGTLLDSEEV